MDEGYDLTEEEIVAETGKSTSEWGKILDRFDVKTNGHEATVKYLKETHNLSSWWSQAIAIRYEFMEGLRK
jgi:transcription initiation factor IIE alpha subunit